jgi:hypothetical protein
MRRALTATLALGLALAAAGCGISDPYQGHQLPAGSTATTAAASTRAPAETLDPAPERNGTIPAGAVKAQAKLVAHAGASTPQAALERYAAISLNWSAPHVVATQRELAAISLGQARALAQQAAASAARDSQLADSQVANSGQVVALSPGQGAATGQWVIVTRELTTGPGIYAGLPPTLHIIYAHVTDTRQGWVVNGWQPQN